MYLINLRHGVPAAPNRGANEMVLIGRHRVRGLQKENRGTSMLDLLRASSVRSTWLGR